ncbi:MAG: alpha-galactosidase [Prevotella sp.]|nr:alpha-galactosidase [Prevotella sp.]
MGWSSWNAFRVNISEDIIKGQADALVLKGLKDAGYKYVNIDDGFFGARDRSGKMQVNAERFPNGMEPVVNHIHSLGLKAGIYTDAGNNTCGSMAAEDHDESGVGAGIYGHEAQDAGLYFGQWGFDFIKIDYCGGMHLGLEEERRYTSIRHSIDKVKKGVALNICRWAFPGAWAKNVADSWRISGDINAHWNSLKYVVGKNLYLSAYAGEGRYNDMDMMVIGFQNNSKVGGNGLGLAEEEAHFGLWCIMSSPLLIGCDLEKTPESSLQLLTNRELIALNQDVLGLQAYVAQHENEGYVLVKDIEQKRGTVRAVALYNPSDIPVPFSVPFSALEFEGEVRIRDLVKHRDSGSFSGSFEQEIPAHSAMILRMEGQTRIEPVLYEAEWAYLPLFDDLGKKPKGILYAADEKSSGKMKVGYCGGSPENYAEWKEVYSKDGGFYDMTIFYSFGNGRKLELTVNDQKQVIEDLGTDDNRAGITVPVKLKPGYNTVRMGNSYDWAPDIDCFTLTRK